MNKNELTTQQLRKYNGQTIMHALRFLGNKATIADLSKCIAQSIQQPENSVRNEVTRVLNRGVDDGFLLKRGQNYVLVGKDDYQVDFQDRGEQSDSDCETDELVELRERQKLRNELEIRLYKMSTKELRKLHNSYVQKDN